MKFGVILQAKHLTPTFEDIKKIALKADELEFHSIWASDHLMHPFPVKGKPRHYCHEAWTIMSALAALTQNVRLGFCVLIPTFRHPSVLAKMAASLDEISNGRLIMCIGAGWFKREYDAYNIPWKEHDQRIEREKEEILVIKALWTQQVANFSGKYYTIKEAIMDPKPLQKPHPPIWVGGNSLKTMKLAAELAEGWFSRSAPPEKIKYDINFIKTISKNKNMDYAVTIEELPLNKLDKCANLLREYAKAGVTLITIPFSNAKDLECFSRDVLPVI